MNMSKDMSTDFNDFTNLFFFPDKLSSYDLNTGIGTIEWKRKNLYTRQAFNTNTILPQDLTMLDFPNTEYENNPKLKFRVDFISPSTVRIRMFTSPVELKEGEELMLVKTPGKDNSWIYSKLANGHQYKGTNGTLEIENSPFRIVLKDNQGKILSATRRPYRDWETIGRAHV